jgi:hypothetical protein
MRSADAPNAVKDEVNRAWFAEFIAAQRRSLTAFDARTSKSDNVLFAEFVASLDLGAMEARGAAQVTLDIS